MCIQQAAGCGNVIHLQCKPVYHCHALPFA